MPIVQGPRRDADAHTGFRAVVWAARRNPVLPGVRTRLARVR
jgi:hypothetical protein